MTDIPVGNIRKVADIRAVSAQMVGEFRASKRGERIVRDVLEANRDRFEEMKRIPELRKPASTQEVELHMRTAGMMAELRGARTDDPFVLNPVFAVFWNACRAITTGEKPEPVRPYSPFRPAAAKQVAFSGQVGFVPGTTELAGQGVGVQTSQIMRNIGATLEKLGSTWSDVENVLVALLHMEDYPSFDDTYVAASPCTSFPARTCIEAKPPKDARVEITVLQAGVPV